MGTRTQIPGSVAGLRQKRPMPSHPGKALGTTAPGEVTHGGDAIWRVRGNCFPKFHSRVADQRPQGGTHRAERCLEKLIRRSILGRGRETFVDLMMEERAGAEATGAAEELDVRDQGTGQANSSPLDAVKMRAAEKWCTPYH